MTLHILHLKNYAILEQLQLEEALLRIDKRNYCLINEGSPPAIVMGISGKAEEFINQEKYLQKPIPLIKRFSGGGTVVVDEDTLFISFICERNFVDFVPYPEPIMRWTETIYRKTLCQPSFCLQENDYVIGEKKFGGNAQYLQKMRWLHHSTLLWNYKTELMELLLHPKKVPPYRKSRSHLEFLTKLSDHISSKEEFLTQFKQTLTCLAEVKEISLDEVLPLLDIPHRKGTSLLEIKHERECPPLCCQSSSALIDDELT